MKIIPLSDLHIRRPEDVVIPHFNSDVIVLAGDIVDPLSHVSASYMRILLTKTRYILYVPGNHEFWGHTYFSCHKQIDEIISIVNSELPEPRVFKLGCVTLDGIRFIGATLWTEMRERDGGIASSAIMRDMVDYYKIRKESGGFIQPSDTVSMHNMDKDFILRNIDRSGTNVIVTHHVPTWNHLDPRYLLSELNPAFVSNLDEMILSVTDHVPLWIHGHTHTSFDTTIGKTRIVCNPKGYVLRNGNDENPKFKSGRHINLSPIEYGNIIDDNEKSKMEDI